MHPYPEDTVLVEQARGWVVPEGDLKLMSQDEILKRQVASGSEQRDEAVEEQFEHPAGYPLVASSLSVSYWTDFYRPTGRRFELDGILPPFRAARRCLQDQPR
jgi:hypothetical protein